MFQLPSSTVVCPSCGKRNSARLNFCSACAGRLGKEPSIAPNAAAPEAVASASHRPSDSRFEQPRTVHSAPMPFASQASDSRPLGFWFRFCMTGLVLIIAFATWAVYTMAGSKAVAPSGAAQFGAAPANEPSTALQAQAQPQQPQPRIQQAQTLPSAAPGAAASTRPAETVAAAASASEPAPVQKPAAAPAPAPAAAAARTPPATAEDASRSAAVAALALNARRVESETAADASGSLQSPQPATRRQAIRERARAPVQQQGMDEFIASRNAAWSTPDRTYPSTSSPGYRDAGPPVVQGPGPLVALPAPLASRDVIAPAGDLGPPIAAGPGPLYDFSTPGANRR